MSKHSIIVEFAKGYRVNARRPEPIVPSHLLLRSVMSIASAIGRSNVFEEIARLNVRSTSLLPILRSRGGCFKILVPIASKVLRKLFNALGVEPSYMTLGIASKIIDTCQNSPNVDSLISCVDEKVIKSLGKPSEYLKKEERLAVLGYEYSVKKIVKVVGLRDELDEIGDEAFDEPLRLAMEAHNVLDRVTSAAKVYMIMGIRTLSRLALFLEMPDALNKDLVDILKLLGDLGIGGGRSRGWGTFKLCEGVRLCSDDEKALDKAQAIGNVTKGGYYLLLGTLPVSMGELDLRESLLEIKDSSGFTRFSDLVSGPYVVATGSIVKLREPPKQEGLLLRIELDSNRESFYPFNTFALGA